MANQTHPAGTGGLEVDRESAAAALIAHIQSTSEKQRTLLARELHDELGGLLVGAVMDLAWAEQHLGVPPAELKLKLLRARQTLSAAIDMKRRLIEELRPTLLDNVGLFAALRWLVQTACEAASVPCTLKIPEDDPRFLPDVPISLFRIVQEACELAISRGKTQSIDFGVTLDNHSLTLHLNSMVDPSVDGATAASEPHALAAVRYRTTILGGVFSSRISRAGETTLTATFPRAALLLPADPG